MAEEKAKFLRRVTWCDRAWYQLCRTCCQVSLDVLARPRCDGRGNVPKSGPVLIVSNHQSYLDPPLIGSRITRRLNYLAKKELFHSKLFGALIRSVDAISLDQKGIGFQGIKETLKRLRNNEAVLIFPEGMRSLDGELNPFRKGYINLAIKTSAAIVPMALDGAWAMYPPHQKFPHFCKPRVRVRFGEAITPDDYKGMNEEELHNLVEEKVRALFAEIRIHPPAAKEEPKERLEETTKQTAEAAVKEAAEKAAEETAQKAVGEAAEKPAE